MCDCRPGKMDCDVALILWAHVNAAYETAKITGDYAPYDAALLAYRSHGKED
jgi:hypothetical protein